MASTETKPSMAEIAQNEIQCTITDIGEVLFVPFTELYNLMENKAKSDLMMAIATYAKTCIAENHTIKGGNETNLLEIMDKHLFTIEFTITGHKAAKA